MNILLAVGLLTGVNMVHYEHPVYLDQPAVVGWVMENSPAEKAGIKAGRSHRPHRRLAEPNVGRCVLKSAIQRNKPLDVAVQRGNDFLETADRAVLELGRPGADAQHRYGFRTSPSSSRRLEPKMPAAQAGMHIGDQIVAVNGGPCTLVDVGNSLPAEEQR